MSESLMQVIVILSLVLGIIGAGGSVWQLRDKILNNRKIQDAAESLATKALPSDVLAIVHKTAETAHEIAKFAMTITDRKPNEPPTTLDTPPAPPTA